MKFKDLNPPVIELAANQRFYRVQLNRPRPTSVRVNGLSQEFANDCRAIGLDGILYASAQHPHHICIALFESGIAVLRKRGSQPLVKAGTNQLLQVVVDAVWRSGVPLVDFD